MNKMTKDEYLHEFDVMVEEISRKEGAVYDALYRIAESFLKPYIERMSYKYTVIRDLDVVNDVYHDVLVTLIKNCVDKFLYREDVLNNDAEGFLRWIYTVARNTLTDRVKFYLVKAGHETSLVGEEGEVIDLATNENPLASLEARQMLEECFRAVMEQDSAIYITFTWLLRAIVLASCDIDIDKNDRDYDCVESKANGIVADTFGELTMSEIYAIILLESQTMPWMNFTKSDNARITEKLSQKQGESTVGDMKYSDFFMKKGARATISDWVNRANARIWRSVCAQF